ncbi:hypothetical protein C8J56DRAFT_495842 [Mycena floridula]|nr:hypothetical protein C8J56DRAFT_495842 [Mycena floridula]
MHEFTRPPSYTAPTTAVPVYSRNPSSGENRLAYRARAVELNYQSNGIFVHRDRQEKATLVLQNQEPDAPRPSYGRNAMISGSLTLEDSLSIARVTVELLGMLEFATAEGYTVVEICSNSNTLYTNRPDLPSDRCPTTLSFSFFFPVSFEDRDKLYPVPPSYNTEILVKRQYIKCSYILRVALARYRPSLLSFLGKNTSSFSLDIEYRPRERPPRPLLQSPSFMQTIKACPEEWRQDFFSIPTAEEDISCEMYTPSIGIFAICDKIPFYLQLAGSAASLRALRPPNGKYGIEPIRVYILRQVVFILDGLKIPRGDFILGEAKLTSLPPVYGQTHDQRRLNWEGEVCCEQETSVGGFTAGLFAVQDFLTFEFLTFTSGAQARKVRRGLAIKLVTDSWVDAPTGADVLEARSPV